MPSLRFEVEHSYSKSRSGIEVEVTFRDKGPVRARAKIDTGSEFCIFEREIGELLGINIESGYELRFTTANGGLFTGYGHELSFSTLGHDFQAMVFFADVRRSVLGRIGWLDKVRFGLVEHDSLLYFSRYDS